MAKKVAFLFCCEAIEGMAIFLDVLVDQYFYLLQFFYCGIGVQADINMITQSIRFDDNKSGVFEGNLAFDVTENNA